jgi:predicted N-acetyltransferase YhbS
MNNRQGSRANPSIRAMVRDDIERVSEIFFDAFGTLAGKKGIESRVRNRQDVMSWVWTMYRHGPTERLVAEVDGKVVGFICLNPRGNVGGYGPLAVDPYFSGGGVGSLLLSEGVNRAKGLESLRCFQESFNTTSFYMLYALNFRPVAHLLDLVKGAGVASPAGVTGSSTDIEVGNIDEISRYDMERSRFDRRSDLEFYVRWGKVFCLRHGSRIRGFLVSLPGASSVLLGPMVADGEEEAVSLYRHAVEFHKDRPCRTIVMVRDESLVRTLFGLGFKIYCLSNLMVLGNWSAPSHVESVSIFPEGV